VPVAAARAASSAHAVYLEQRSQARRGLHRCYRGSRCLWQRREPRHGCMRYIWKNAVRPDAACTAATEDRGAYSSGASRVMGACGVSGKTQSGRTRLAPLLQGIAVPVAATRAASSAHAVYMEKRGEARRGLHRCYRGSRCLWQRREPRHRRMRCIWMNAVRPDAAGTAATEDRSACSSGASRVRLPLPCEICG
jgi:hypothetical protein